MTDQTRPMDAERLAEIRERAEAATPGPWEWDGFSEIDEVGAERKTLNPKDGFASRWLWSGNEPVVSEWNTHCCEFAKGVGIASGVTPSPDATFIAHARQDIPDLLAEVARLTAERDALTDGGTRREADYDELARNNRNAVIELARLRAVIEEARGVALFMRMTLAAGHTSAFDLRADLSTELDELNEALDRGPKGSGE